MGDALLAFPALASLRRSFPDHRLLLVGHPGVNPLAVSSGLADEVIDFDDARVARLFIPAEVAHTPPFGTIDIAVAYCADADGVVASNLAAWGARRVVVARGRPPDGSAIHAAHHTWSAIVPLCGGATLEVPTVRVPSEADVLADALDLPRIAFACIHLGSGSAAKNWPIESIAELASRIDQHLGLGLVATAGPAETERLQLFRRACPGARLVDEVALTVLAAVYRRAQLYVGMDTGPTHLAALLGVPTVAIFGPTDPATWRPLGPRVAVIRQQPIESLSSEDVWAAMQSIGG